MDRVIAARAARDPAEAAASTALLKDLCDTMLAGSLCALGGMAPFPVLSAIQYFPEDFGLPAAELAAAAG
jgi:formate dehydrogenase iron-sulfur subunit